MNNLIEALPQLTPYHTALVAFTILCLAVLIQSFIAGVFGLGKSEEVPGMPLQGSHQDFSFRALRTYGNSCENLPMFGFIVLLAIFAGVAPSWVNWLVVIHVAFRLLYWAVYYSGVGKVESGPRTISYVMGILANVILAVMTLWALVR